MKYSTGAAVMAEFLYGQSNHNALSNHRLLQFTPPDYTSPPLPEALAATPEWFQDEEAMENARDLAASGLCDDIAPNACNLLFEPSKEAINSGTAKIGVIYYNGALVDPRGYSLIGKTLAERYGIAVAMPIFANDIAIDFTSGECSSGRIPKVMEAFPDVEKWVLAGHSLGGVAAQNDFWAHYNEDDSIAGLALFGSYISPNACDAMDFSGTNIPMANVLGELDGIVNVTNAQDGRKFLPQNDTFFMLINGGNHGDFGTYDASGREEILGQFEPDSTIPNSVQIELSIQAIVQVASRTGLPLPAWDSPSHVPHSVGKKGGKNGKKKSRKR